MGKTARTQHVLSRGVGLTNKITPVNRYLSLTGLSSGSKAANVDGTVAKPFFIAPPTTGVFEITRMIVQIRDSGTVSADTYGALAALTNGIDVGLGNATGVIQTSFLDGLLIKANAEWARLCYDADLKDWGVGAGDDFVVARWTFERGGYRILLDSDVPGTTFSAVVADNLTGLVAHTFMVQGIHRV